MSRFSSPWRITSGVRATGCAERLAARKSRPRRIRLREDGCAPALASGVTKVLRCGRPGAKAGCPGGRPSFLEQLARMHAERTRELADVSQPHVNPRVFDLADEVLLLAGIDRKRRLRQPLGLAQPAHVLGRQSFDVYGPPHRTTYIELDIFSRPLQTIGVAT